jgi:hypothetical protein
MYLMHKLSDWLIELDSSWQIVQRPIPHFLGLSLANQDQVSDIVPTYPGQR